MVVITGYQPVEAQILPGPQRTDWDQEQRKYSAEALEGVRQLMADWQGAVASDDASAVARYYTDNAVAHLWDDAPLEGRPAIEQALRAALPTISALETGVSDFSASGRLFYVFGRFWYQHEPEGESARAVTGVYVVVAERGNRDWRIRSQIFKEDPPPSDAGLSSGP